MFLLPSLLLACCLVVASAAPAPPLLPYPRAPHPAGALGPLYVVRASNLTSGEIVTLQTLSGVLARESPTLYTVHSDPTANATVAADNTVFWLRRLQAQGIPTSLAHVDGDLDGLFRRFRANVTGYVVFDTAQKNSTNAALIHCAGAKGNVVAVDRASSPALRHTLDELGIPQEADVSALSPFEAFQASRSGLTRRMAAFQPDDGSKSGYLSAYAVAGRFPVLEHAPGGSHAFDAVLANWDPDTLNAALGWTSWDEHIFVSAVTAAGGYVHASDFLSNLEVLSNLPPPVARPPRQQQQQRPPTQTLTGPLGKNDHTMHTVAFIMSDGDNLQLLAGDWQTDRWYGSPQRGAVPLGWSFAAATAALLPTVLDYVRGTMTANDSLQAGPSGAGYAYPALFAEKQAALFAEATGRLMGRANMSVLNPIGVTPSVESLSRLMALPEVASSVYFTFGKAQNGYAGLHGNVDYLAGKPIVGARMNLWGNGFVGDKVGWKALVRELKTLPTDSTNPAAYSIVVVNMGSHNYSDVVRAVQALEAAGDFDVVLPEVLLDRLVQRTDKQVSCPLPSGRWGVAAGDLPKCSIASSFRRRGSCVFDCSNIESGTRVARASCDLRVCSNLTLSASKSQFLCPDGQACPSQ